MFLRLDQQAQALADKDSAAPFRKIVNERILPHGPDLPLLPTRLSPIGSSCPLSAVVLRVLSAATSGSEGATISKDDIRSLYDAVEMALSIPPVVSHGNRNTGVDELLFGRAGLLWALLNMRTHRFNKEAANALAPVFEAVPRLVDVIVDAGRQGSKSYSKQHGTKGSLPLMWTWMEGYVGIGA